MSFPPWYPQNGVFSFTPATPARQDLCRECGSMTCLKGFCGNNRPRPVTLASPARGSSFVPTTPSPFVAFAPTPPANAFADNLFCNHCGAKPIVGKRVRCVTCDDYDLCGKCDKLNDEAIDAGRAPIHPANHVYITTRKEAAAKTLAPSFSF